MSHTANDTPPVADGITTEEAIRRLEAAMDRAWHRYQVAAERANGAWGEYEHLSSQRYALAATGGTEA
jgi:hypothetical protein